MPANSQENRPLPTPGGRILSFLLGPTGTGKSRLALRWAAAHGAEIVSLDSMAVYRGMDIGTAKPTPEDRRPVPHHLIDLRDPWETFNVGEYVSLAERTIREILLRGRPVLFVGGTPLYYKGITAGLSPAPPADPGLREELSRLPDLWERLHAVDPVRAGQLHPHDVKRLSRALEIAHLTGRKPSEEKATFDSQRRDFVLRVAGLALPRDRLYRRIDARIDRMVRDGWIEEVGRLRNTGKPLGSTARQALGYREWWEYLEKGGNREAIADRIKKKTHNFARHQETWFRKFTEVAWVDADLSEEALYQTLDRALVPAP